MSDGKSLHMHPLPRVTDYFYTLSNDIGKITQIPRDVLGIIRDYADSSPLLFKAPPKQLLIGSQNNQASPAMERLVRVE